MDTLKYLRYVAPAGVEQVVEDRMWPPEGHVDIHDLQWAVQLGINLKEEFNIREGELVWRIDIRKITDGTCSVLYSETFCLKGITIKLEIYVNETTERLLAKVHNVNDNGTKQTLKDVRFKFTIVNRKQGFDRSSSGRSSWYDGEYQSTEEVEVISLEALKNPNAGFINRGVFYLMVKAEENPIRVCCGYDPALDMEVEAVPAEVEVPIDIDHAAAAAGGNESFVM